MHSSSSPSNPLSAFCLAMNNSGGRVPQQNCEQQEPAPNRSPSLTSSDLTLSSRGNSTTEIGYLPTNTAITSAAPLMMQQQNGNSLFPPHQQSLKAAGSSSGGVKNVTAPATSAYPSLKSLSPCSSSGSFSNMSPQATPLLGGGIHANQHQQQQYVTVQLPNQEAGHHLVLQQPKPQLLVPGIAPLLAAPLVAAPPIPVASSSLPPPPPTYGATVGPGMPTPGAPTQHLHRQQQTSKSGGSVNFGEMWRAKHGKKNKA